MEGTARLSRTRVIVRGHAFLVRQRIDWVSMDARDTLIAFSTHSVIAMLTAAMSLTAQVLLPAERSMKSWTEAMVRATFHHRAPCHH